MWPMRVHALPRMARLPQPGWSGVRCRLTMKKTASQQRQCSVPKVEDGLRGG